MSETLFPKLCLTLAFLIERDGNKLKDKQNARVHDGRLMQDKTDYAGYIATLTSYVFSFLAFFRYNFNSCFLIIILM